MPSYVAVVRSHAWRASCVRSPARSARGTSRRSSVMHASLMSSTSCVATSAAGAPASSAWYTWRRIASDHASSAGKEGSLNTRLALMSACPVASSTSWIASGFKRPMAGSSETCGIASRASALMILLSSAMAPSMTLSCRWITGDTRGSRFRSHFIASTRSLMSRSFSRTARLRPSRLSGSTPRFSAAARSACRRLSASRSRLIVSSARCGSRRSIGVPVCSAFSMTRSLANLQSPRSWPSAILFSRSQNGQNGTRPLRSEPAST
mmetsp:Transcript_46115/g.142051  ORF Transcript_46115/g.142051 Transcript_46115/m.142051 type:complete len:265 (-) Transcript_46115:2258-3052(-)